MPATDPPGLVPQIVEKCRKGPGIVSGIRKDRRSEPLYYRLAADAFNWYLNRVLKVDVPKNCTDFHAFSRQSVNAITRIKDRLRYLRVFSAFVGYGHETLVYEPVQRRARPRVKSLGQAFTLALNLVVANWLHPLRSLSLVGLVLTFFSTLRACWVTIHRVLMAPVLTAAGEESVYSAWMFTFLFLMLSILCAYVGRLLAESRDRPLYYVLEERNSSVLISNEERKNVVTESIKDA